MMEKLMSVNPQKTLYMHCTVLHINKQVLFRVGNQSNHQNSEKTLLSYKFGLIFIGMKQKKIWNDRLKKTEIFKSPNSQ